MIVREFINRADDFGGSEILILASGDPTDHRVGVARVELDWDGGVVAIIPDRPLEVAGWKKKTRKAKKAKKK